MFVTFGMSNLISYTGTKAKAGSSEWRVAEWPLEAIPTPATEHSGQRETSATGGTESEYVETDMEANHKFGPGPGGAEESHERDDSHKDESMHEFWSVSHRLCSSNEEP